MATACTTDVISALIQVGDLEALQRVTPADYDWFGYLSKTQHLPLVEAMTAANAFKDIETHVKIVSWMVKGGANPLQKYPSTASSACLCTWVKSDVKASKITIPHAGHCATTLACAMLREMQSSPHAEAFSTGIQLFRRFVTELTTGPAKIAQSNVSVPQSVVDTWEAVREMTSTHNVVFQTADGEVSAHDFILVTTSPVLRAMLDSTMKEGLSKRIPVKDSSGSGVRLFVDLLYTSSTGEDPNYQTMLVALDLAHRWQVNGVVSVLAGMLSEMIAVNSFPAIAEAAMLKGLEPLQRACRTFGASNAKIKTMLRKGTLPAEVRKLLGDRKSVV